MLDLPELDVPLSRMVVPPATVSGIRARAGSAVPGAGSAVPGAASAAMLSSFHRLGT